MEGVRGHIIVIICLTTVFLSFYWVIDSKYSLCYIVPVILLSHQENVKSPEAPERPRTPRTRASESPVWGFCGFCGFWAFCAQRHSPHRRPLSSGSLPRPLYACYLPQIRRLLLYNVHQAGRCPVRRFSKPGNTIINVTESFEVV